MVDRDALFVEMVEVLGNGALTDEELRAALAERGTDIGRPDRYGVDDLQRVRQDRMDLATLLDGRTGYTPALAHDVSWTFPVTDLDVDRGFTVSEPHLTALVGWLISESVHVVDADGEPLGPIVTDGVLVDGGDRDVIFWPDAALSTMVPGIYSATILDPATLQLAAVDEVSSPSPQQVAAVGVAFEQTHQVETIEAFMSGDELDIAKATVDDLVVAMVIADPAAFRSAPLPLLSDLFAATEFEMHAGHHVGPVGTDWAALDSDLRVRRTTWEFGLEREQAKQLILLVGATTARDENGDLELGSSNEEVGGALTLIASILQDAQVAEAAWERWSDLGVTGPRLDDVVDELDALFDEKPLPGLAWFRSRQAVMADRTDEAIDWLQRANDLDENEPHAGVLADLAAFEADRSNPLAARRLLVQAGVDVEIDLEDDGPTASGRGFGAELAEEISPFAAVRPRPMAGRNDTCPCGSGRKYKQCHLGNELHPLDHRAGWLFVKMMRFLGLVAPNLSGEVADDIADEVYDEDLRSMVMNSFIPTDMALHEGGIAARFATAKAGLLPADEQALADAWATTDRSVYEVVRSTRDRMDVLDLASRERLTVVDTVPEEPLEAGWKLLGRLLPVGDEHRAYGGFLPVNDDMIEPLLEACATRHLETMAIAIGHVFEAAQGHDEMQKMFDESLDTTELESLIQSLSDEN